MIPKIIHYCWLSGDPIPEKLQRYMNTWKKHLPDYEFMLWDKSRFDIDACRWVRQAYDQKKYAFASDYIRFFALYHYGGIYLDMDVQVLKSYTPFLPLHTMVGYEDRSELLEVATFGAEKGLPWLKQIMEYYEMNDFVYDDEAMEKILCPPLVTRVLKQCGYRMVNVSSLAEALALADNENLIPVFPCDYFCPKEWSSQLTDVTNQTYSIHHYAGSWMPEEIRKRRQMKERLPQWLLRLFLHLREL